MADNAGAHAALRAQIDRMRALPDRMLKDAPPLVAAELGKSLRASIAAGTDPFGKPWERTKTGAVPLRNAGKALTIRVIGTVVLAKLVGPEALHHLGIAAGKIRRQILPTKRVPQTLTEAIKRVLAKDFAGVMNGR